MPKDEFDSCEVEILRLWPELPPFKFKIFLDDNETFIKNITVRFSLGLTSMGEFRKLQQDEGLENKFRTSPFRHFQMCLRGQYFRHLYYSRVLQEKTQDLWVNYKRLPVRFGLCVFAIMIELNCRHSYPNLKIEKYFLDDEDLSKLIPKERDL